MEHPGVIPPDRDSYSGQQSSNFNTLSGQHSISSSSVGVSTSSTSQHQHTQQHTPQQPFERLSRPLSFDKVSVLYLINVNN